MSENNEIQTFWISGDGRATPLSLKDDWPMYYEAPARIGIGRDRADDGWWPRSYRWTERRERALTAAWRRVRGGKTRVSWRDDEGGYNFAVSDDETEMILRDGALRPRVERVEN